MSRRPLNTTSYAILGVLAIRSWSAYDLTAYMRASAVRRCWPRTESRLYAEPKNLVAHGLARASREYTGKRRRTVYEITAQGRRALARWLGERATREETEDEALLKILLCDHGSRDQLLATIRWAMEDLLERAEGLLERGGRVAQGEGRFPERLHVNALAAGHGIGKLRERLRFLAWVDEWVRSWDDTALDERKRQTALDALADANDELAGIAETLRERLGRGEGGGREVSVRNAGR